jgi:hypothetical protein
MASASLALAVLLRGPQGSSARFVLRLARQNSENVVLVTGRLLLLLMRTTIVHVMKHTQLHLVLMVVWCLDSAGVPEPLRWTDLLTELLAGWSTRPRDAAGESSRQRRARE